jgi:DNA-binding MarR family transcriptional regulator
MTAGSHRPLTRHELELWRAWQRASQEVNARVARDVSEASGLSAADFAVLSLLIGDGSGKLRQHELAGAVGWHKSRISHQLSRMEHRALVRRDTLAGNAVLVAATSAGKRAFAAARAVHAAAVRRHLLSRVRPHERRHLLALLGALAADESSSG